MIFTSFDPLIRSCWIVKTLHNFIYSYTYYKSVKPYIISVSWIIFFLWSHDQVKLYEVIHILLSHHLDICKLDIWIESCCNNSWNRRISSWSQVEQAFSKSLVLLKAKWLVYVMAFGCIFITSINQLLGRQYNVTLGPNYKNVFQQYW